MKTVRVHGSVLRNLLNSKLSLREQNFAFFSYYMNNPQEGHILGFEDAAKFRIKFPDIPIVFFSFLPYDHLLRMDETGVLSLPGTVFVRLPCEKTDFQNLVKNTKNNGLSWDGDQWHSFLEKTCEILLIKRISELNHGKKFEIGNRAIHPLRAAATLILNSSDNGSYAKAFETRLNACKQYIRNPEIQEMIEWAEMCKYSNNHFIKQVLSLSRLLIKINGYSVGSSGNEVINLINYIDQLNSIMHSLLKEKSHGRTV